MTARQTIGLLLLVTFLPNCTTWSRYEGEGAPEDEDRVRVWHLGGEHRVVAEGATMADALATREEPGRIVLEGAFVAGEDFVGTAHASTPREEIRYIPLASVERFDVETIDPVSSAFLAIGIGGLIVAVLAAVGASQMGEG